MIEPEEIVLAVLGLATAAWSAWMILRAVWAREAIAKAVAA